MLHQPFEDPRRFLDQRIQQLDEQLLELNASGSLMQGRDTLMRLSEGFRDHTVEPEDVCLAAMKVYWAHQGAIRATPVGHNLASLGHDFGATASVSFEDLESYWEQATGL